MTGIFSFDTFRCYLNLLLRACGYFFFNVKSKVCCTTTWIYLMLLACTLKVAKRASFVLCIFFHNKTLNRYIYRFILSKRSSREECRVNVCVRRLQGDSKNKFKTLSCDPLWRLSHRKGLLWGLERTQDMRISCGGEPGNFLFPFELWLDSALLCEIKAQTDLLGSVTSFLPE